MKKEFYKSLIIFVPLCLIMSLLTLKTTDLSLSKAFLTGFVGSLFVFFVPFKLKKRE